MYKRRLQVFVSSTYSDLREERQAAVEAILTAGHIPAGMELFAAGDQSQMEVIRQWIDDSDVFLLILGGRYGSIDAESGKSYTHLEYEHAVSVDKPLFVCVIEERALDERLKLYGAGTIERQHPDKLSLFRSQVLSRVVRFWSDSKDIKLAIYESLGDIARRSGLRGWVRADQAVDAVPLAEELARLVRENSELKTRLSETPTLDRYGGLSFLEMKTLLSKSKINPAANAVFARWEKLAQRDFHDQEVSMLHAFWGLRRDLADGVGSGPEPLYSVLRNLLIRGFVRAEIVGYGTEYILTSEGYRFLNRLELDLMRSGENIEMEGGQGRRSRPPAKRKPRKRGTAS